MNQPSAPWADLRNQSHPLARRQTRTLCPAARTNFPTSTNNAAITNTAALPPVTSASALSLPPSTYLDPTTQTAFPSSLPSPSAPLQLVGTGVRTVSFLAVRVYTAGFYLAEGALSQPALRGFTPERLISPRPEDEGLVGEELMGTVLEGTSAGVVIGEC